MTLQNTRKLHRWIATFLTLFILAHVGNHIAGAFNPDLHIAIQHKLELVYGIPLIDAGLIIGFIAQIVIGLLLYAKTRKLPQKGWSRAQKISGLVLALFLTQHISANLAMRLFIPQLETNYYWAASVVSFSPVSWYFIPYYFAGLVALGTHIAAFARVKMVRTNSPKLAVIFPRAIVCLSVLSGLWILTGLTGAVYPYKFPSNYTKYISDFYGINVPVSQPIPAG